MSMPSDKRSFSHANQTYTVTIWRDTEQRNAFAVHVDQSSQRSDRPDQLHQRTYAFLQYFVDAIRFGLDQPQNDASVGRRFGCATFLNGRYTMLWRTLCALLSVVGAGLLIVSSTGCADIATAAASGVEDDPIRLVTVIPSKIVVGDSLGGELGGQRFCQFKVDNAHEDTDSFEITAKGFEAEGLTIQPVQSQYPGDSIQVSGQAPVGCSASGICSIITVKEKLKSGQQGREYYYYFQKGVDLWSSGATTASDEEGDYRFQPPVPLDPKYGKHFTLEITLNNKWDGSKMNATFTLSGVGKPVTFQYSAGTNALKWPFVVETGNAKYDASRLIPALGNLRVTVAVEQHPEVKIESMRLLVY